MAVGVLLKREAWGRSWALHGRARSKSRRVRPCPVCGRLMKKNGKTSAGGGGARRAPRHRTRPDGTSVFRQIGVEGVGGWFPSLVACCVWFMSEWVFR